MQSFFLVLISLVLVQRFIELGIARRNTAVMRARGAIEFGAAHYPLIVGVHVCFFVAVSIEVIIFKRSLPSYWLLPFFVFMLAQLLRWWSIFTLRSFWNTRILVLPQTSVVRHGPYRLLRHPNYVVVILELLSFPLIFGAYVTATIVSILNFLVLRYIRIPIEEQALATMTNYEQTMGQTARLLPAPLPKNRL